MRPKNVPFHIIIPARYDSQRLPGKVLLPLKGKPILQWVYEQSMKSGATSVTIATDDLRIVKAVETFGGKSILTAPTHRSGSDRIAEAAKALHLLNGEVIVNVQGDEPFMPVSAILQVAQSCQTSEYPVSTLCKVITDLDIIDNLNVVKVVFNHNNEALYFSRSVIPYMRSDHSSSITYYQHIGLYAYKSDFLQQYVSWGPCELEQAEGLEQLRILWHGYKIQVTLAIEAPVGDVNTIEDYEKLQCL